MKIVPLEHDQIDNFSCITNLNWGWLECKYLVPCSLGIAIHVDQNMNAISINTISCLPIVRDLHIEWEGEGYLKTVEVLLEVR